MIQLPSHRAPATAAALIALAVAFVALEPVALSPARLMADPEGHGPALALSAHEAYVALGEIADLLKGLRVAGKASDSSTELPEGADPLLVEAIQAVFAAQRIFER